MLVLDLGIGRVEDPELRHGRAQQALLDVRHPMRILRVEPPRVILHYRRHGRYPPRKPDLQQLVEDIRLD